VSTTPQPSTDAGPVRVRVLQLGRRVLGHSGALGLTVQGTLDALGLSAAMGVDLRVNGRPADGERVLSDGDVVTLIPRIKGGTF
jgi:molybdopterin converting factor small subunit